MERIGVDPVWQDLGTIERLVRESRTIAVVGLSDRPERPSFGVARYLVAAGLTVFPVNPALRTWQGLTAYPSLAEVPEHVDVVDVFRKPTDVEPVVRDAIAAGAGAMWFQLGVVNPAAARLAADAGLAVVVDRCLAVEHREVVGWS